MVCSITIKEDLIGGISIEKGKDRSSIITVINLETWLEVSRTCVPHAHIVEN
jgi:hypothetical protein